MFLLAFSLLTSSVLPAVSVSAAEDTYKDRFDTMYKKIHGTKFFDEEGIPYHSVETFCIEAPDYGHESTSEAVSYYAWLEAMNGKLNNDWSGLSKAWDVAEKYFIPSESQQRAMSTYKPSSPAGVTDEYPLPDYYPAEIQNNVSAGQDPLHEELYRAYNTYAMYGMHWLVDVDNWYGFGTGTNCTYINTYQRGEQESVFETIPQPSIEDFKYGGRQGFADLFVAGETAKKWSFTIASDADGRMIQVQYWADKWAKEQGKDLSSLNAKASKMGDYLRYSLYDKYFMKIGAQSKTPATGNDSCHYLLAWYYAWGGAADGTWSWKIGCSHVHWGYQAPLAAYALANSSSFTPKSSGGKDQWAKSYQRQLELYAWLQSSEGAIAGGCTNSVGGQYKKYDSSLGTFYDMVYDYAPVYRDPDSNQWFGMQCWSMQRMCEVYYETGNELAKQICDKWIEWADSEVSVDVNKGTWKVPSTLIWKGTPDTWKGSKPQNSNLHVSVKDYGNDIGVTGSTANAFLFYAAATKKHNGNTTLGEKVAQKACDMLDVVWNTCQDEYGVGKPETNGSLSRAFKDIVYVPDGWEGKMPNGDVIKPGITFMDIRSKYKDDPWYNGIKNQTEDNLYEYTLHRFWHAVDYSVALGLAHSFGYTPGNTGGTKIIPGDVDLNGSVNAIDFGHLRKHMLGITELTGDALKAADVDGNGSVNAIDFGHLRKILLGME